MGQANFWGFFFAFAPHLVVLRDYYWQGLGRPYRMVELKPNMQSSALPTLLLIQHRQLGGVVVGAHLMMGQRLLLALHSRITAGSDWGIIWDSRNQSQVGCMQGKQPYLLYYLFCSQYRQTLSILFFLLPFLSYC